MTAAETVNLLPSELVCGTGVVTVVVPVIVARLVNVFRTNVAVVLPTVTTVSVSAVFEKMSVAETCVPVAIANADGVELTEVSGFGAFRAESVDDDGADTTTEGKPVGGGATRVSPNVGVLMGAHSIPPGPITAEKVLP